MVSAEFEGTCTMMQSAAAGDPLSPEASYLRGMAAAGYPHPDSALPHPHHPHMQVKYPPISCVHHDPDNCRSKHQITVFSISKLKNWPKQRKRVNLQFKVCNLEKSDIVSAHTGQHSADIAGILVQLLVTGIATGQISIYSHKQELGECHPLSLVLFSFFLHTFCQMLVGYFIPTSTSFQLDQVFVWDWMTVVLILDFKLKINWPIDKIDQQSRHSKNSWSTRDQFVEAIIRVSSFARAY